MRTSSFVSAMVVAPLLALTSASATANAGIWDVWLKKAKQTCPDHHLEWLAGDDYDELPGSFILTLSKITQKKIQRISDYSHRCAQETMGFYCEMSVDLDAFQELDLLNRFMAFACASRKCEEAAICTHPSLSPAPK